MRLEPRIKKLEDRAPKELPKIRIQVLGVYLCPDKPGPCEHVIAVEIDGKLVHRLPGETRDALVKRAFAAVTGSGAPVTLIVACEVTSHDDPDTEPRRTAVGAV